MQSMHEVQVQMSCVHVCYSIVLLKALMLGQAANRAATA